MKIRHKNTCEMEKYKNNTNRIDVSINIGNEEAMIKDMESDYKVYKIRRDEHDEKQQPSHVHPYYEIFYLLNGDCTFFLDHNVYKLSQGDMVIVPAGTIHKSTFPVKGYSDRFVVCFKEKSLNWIKEVIGEAMVRDCLQVGIISIPEKRRDYVEAIINKMIFENEGQDILSPAFIRTSLIELLLFIIRCQRFEENVVKEIDVDNQLIQEVATYIYNNYNKKLSLDDMAVKFHISKSYLSKKFKRVTGFGFKEYIVNMRIKNACRMLLDTDMSITDIAFECGFNDSNYFGDAFRHVKGVSPNKYRKNKETI